MMSVKILRKSRRQILGLDSMSKINQKYTKLVVVVVVVHLFLSFFLSLLNEVSELTVWLERD